MLLLMGKGQQHCPFRLYGDGGGGRDYVDTIQIQFNSIQYFIFPIKEYNIHVMSCAPV